MYQNCKELVNGLVQERRNSIANTLDLALSFLFLNSLRPSDTSIWGCQISGSWGSVHLIFFNRFPLDVHLGIHVYLWKWGAKTLLNNRNPPKFLMDSLCMKPWGSVELPQKNPYLTAWHICVSKLTITSSDNGLSPDRRQAIIWTNAGILLFAPLGTNLSEIQTFSFKKMHLKVSSAKRRPFCLGLNVLI